MDGVFVGRVSPFHLGHELVVGDMIENCSVGNSLLVIGSSNHPWSLFHFFSYEERRHLAKMLFPELRIVGLSDYPTDDEWITALDDLLTVAGMIPEETTFFGGCSEDIIFFIKRNRKTRILNRFDGTTPKVSATEVRDALIHDRSLDSLVNVQIGQELRGIFKPKWEIFKKT